MKTIANKLASYSKAISYKDLSKEDRYQTKVRIIDAIACAFGGYDSEMCKKLRTLPVSEMTKGGATILGTPHKTAPHIAAFLNEAFVRYLDFNDTYLSKEPAHPSDNIAVCLAAAESEKKSGRDLMVAVLLAYEIQCRLCDAAGIRKRGFDHTPYGAISTAAACAKLIKGNIEEAINMATASNNILRQTRIGELSHWKNCSFAQAGMNGLFAAQLSKAGITGPRLVFEGEKGFENVISGSLKGLKFTRSHMLPKTYIKLRPAEYHSQASIDAALILREKVKPSEIKSITIEIYDTAIEIIADKTKWRPKNKETADHSLPFIIATALIYGEVGLASYTKARYQNTRILALMDKMKTKHNKTFSKEYGRAFSNILHIETKDGKRFKQRIDHAKGHPKNPATKEDIEEKFITLTAKYFSPQKQRALLKTLWSLEKLKDVSKLMKSLMIKS